MKTVTICEDLLSPSSWQTTEVEDVCAFLTSQWKEFPSTGRIYLDYVSDANEVTPHSVKDIEKLQEMQGHFYIVIYPEGPLVILVIVAIAIACVAIGLVFLLRPNTPPQPEQSPNNQLTDRQNRARPNERIPDIFGTVRSTPDLVQVPYRMFFNNLEYEINYMCSSRGSLTVIDCMDDTTPVSWIDGEFVAVYGPNTSPNGVALGESTPQQTFGVNPLPSIPQVVSVQQSGSVNGQVLRAPNSGNLNTNKNVSFQYPDVMQTNGGSNLDFTDYYVASTVTNPQYLNIYNDSDGSNASDPAQRVHSVAITGRYLIISVTPTTVVLGAPGGGVCDTVCAAWDTLATFEGQASTYYHSFQVLGEGNVQVGPIILQIADLNSVLCNFVSKGGLYYVDNNGNQHGYTFTVQVSVQGVDVNNNAIGDIISGVVNLVGSSVDRIDVGSSLQFTMPTPGPVQVWAKLLTPKSTDNRNSYNDQIQWRDLYGVSPVAATNFGNVTTLMAITSPTPAALSVKSRKINMLVTRNVPTWNNRNGFALAAGQAAPTFSAPIPSNNAADIFCAMALDPYIGRRSIAELNVPDIYAQADSSIMGAGRRDGTIASYFGTFLATEFCATLDDSKVSFEESAVQLAQAINCIAYRRGSSLSLFFEAQTENSCLLFNHRNKLPDSETRTVTFGTLNDNDGIEYDYIDPNAPNFPNLDTTVTLYFPADQSAQNPKKVKSIGVRNRPQAMLNGWRLYQKLIHQNSQVEFEGTQESALLILNNRILVADNTRNDTQDGEIIDQNGLLVVTSQNVTFAPGQTYTAFIQHYDETVEAIGVTAGPQPNQVLLATAPRLPLVYDKTMFAQTTYIIIGSAAVRSNAFLLSNKEWQQNGTYKLTAVNYDDAYYTHDTDVSTGVVTIPAQGYGPQGYTGSGSAAPPVDISGPIGIRPDPPRLPRPPIAYSTFASSSLYGTVHAHAAVVTGVVTGTTATVGGTIRTVTATGLVLPTDGTIRADSTAGAITLTLPITPDDGQVVIVKKIDASANAVTINGNGNLIDGSATKTIAAQYGVLRLEFDLTSSTWGLY